MGTQRQLYIQQTPTKTNHLQKLYSLEKESSLQRSNI